MIMLYSLNLHNVIYRLYLNKARKKKRARNRGTLDTDRHKGKDDMKTEQRERATNHKHHRPPKAVRVKQCILP